MESGSPLETERVARVVAAQLDAGGCVALYGELGAGKSVFTRGLIHGLGVGEEVAVTSPTFVIVSEYEGRVRIHHVDAYRLSGPGDIVGLGSRELFFEEAVSVVEWADRVEKALPDERLDVSFEITGREGRRLCLSAAGEWWREALRKVNEALRAGADVKSC